MRVLFAGNSAIAVPSLLSLAETQDIVGVLTNPESAQGRGRGLLSTAVAAAAREKLKGIPVFTFDRLAGEQRETIAALKPDILVAFAYGKLFGPKFLALFPRGGINIHPSLLPRHRGSSPLQQTILDGDSQTGVCVQAIAPEMDTGALYAVEKFAVAERETAASLSLRCAHIGARLAAATLDAMEKGGARAVPQEGEPSYCRKISKEDGLVDWTSACADIDARIRAFDPWPGSYSYLQGRRLAILEAAPCFGDELSPAGEALPKAAAGTIIGVDKNKGILVQTGAGLIALKKLQFEARKALDHRAFANGFRELAGLRFRPEP